MAASAVLYKRGSDALVELQRTVHSETSGESKDYLNALSHALRKLQDDLNSCITAIISEETTVGGSATLSEGLNEDESDESDDCTEKGQRQEPCTKKIRT